MCRMQPTLCLVEHFRGGVSFLLCSSRRMNRFASEKIILVCCIRRWWPSWLSRRDRGGGGAPSWGGGVVLPHAFTTWTSNRKRWPLSLSLSQVDITKFIWTTNPPIFTVPCRYKHYCSTINVDSANVPPCTASAKRNFCSRWKCFTVVKYSCGKYTVRLS